MLCFREWLVVKEVLGAVYDDIVAEIVMAEAVRSTVVLVSRAISGEIFAESSEPESAEDRLAAARRIFGLAQRVRWSAMIDRRQSVIMVREAFNSKYIPMVRETAEAFEEMVEAERRNQKNPESAAARGYAETNVARELGITKAFLQRVAKIGLYSPTKTRSESSEHDDIGMPDDLRDDIEMPDDLLDDEPSDKNPHMVDFEEKFKSLSSDVGPLLIKMGYINERQIEYGSFEDKFKAFDEAISRAAAEKGNEVPKNPTTNELKASPEKRRTAAGEFMQALHDTLGETAEGYGRSGIRPYWDSVKQRMVGGEDTAPEEFFDAFALALVDSLRTRSANKVKIDQDEDEDEDEDDEHAGEENSSGWKDPTLVKPPAGDEMEWASRYINTLKARLSQEAIKQNQRSRNRAAGLKSDSDSPPTSLQSGGREEDGSRSSIDPADFRGSTADRELMSRRRREDILDSFVYAMRKLRQESPLKAMLVCIRFGLQCDHGGGLPADEEGARTAVEKILDIVPTQNLGDRQGGRAGAQINTPEAFLAKLGVSDDVGGSDRANQEMAGRLQSTPGVPPRDSNGRPLTIWDTLGKSPSPKDNNGNPITRKPNDPEGLDKWTKFVKTAVDQMGESFKRIALHMRSYLAGTDEVIAHGRIEASEEDGERWDFATWARRAFERNDKVELRPEGRGEFRLNFFDAEGKVKISWKIKVSDYRFPGKGKMGQKIVMVQDGFPEEHVDYAPPMKRCERCEGEDEECPDCRGFGYVLDYPEITALEGRLYNTLIRDKRRGSRKGD